MAEVWSTESGGRIPLTLPEEAFMAIVNITIIEGRDRETKNLLMKRLTDAVVETLDAKPGQVRVVINEVQDGDYAVGGNPVFLRDHAQ